MDSSNIKVWTSRAASGCKALGRLSAQGYRRAQPVVVSLCRTTGQQTVRFYRYSKPIAVRQWQRLEQTPFFQKYKKRIYQGVAAVALLLLVFICWPGTKSHGVNGSAIFVDLTGNTTPGIVVSPITDLSTVPSVDGRAPPIAAGRFEPSGAQFVQGLKVTWALPARREPGSKLWIINLDGANKRWLGTGQTAEVSSSGKQASGLVYHFSTIGLGDQEAAVKEGNDGGKSGGPRKWGALAQLASYVELKHGGSAEDAMVEYNKWLAKGGEALVASLKQKVQENIAQQEQYRKALQEWEHIPESQRPPKDFKEPKTAFESIVGTPQEALIKDLMVKMYGAAGQGKESFHTVALVIDKGLQAPSEEFKKNKYSADPVNNELSLVMAEARDHWIDEVIIEVAQKNGWKVRRSDSGNQTSGMKSDLDQTFDEGIAAR